MENQGTGADKMNIKILRGGPFSSLCYCLESDKGILLIDTGDGTVPINFDPSLVILTHNHKDHTMGVKPYWTVYLHPLDFQPNEYSYIPPNAKPLNFDHIKWGEWNLKIIHTPGHTPGSICLYDTNKKILFSGDTLFHNGVGRTDLGGNEKQLKNSLKKIKKLEISKLCPGHEY